MRTFLGLNAILLCFAATLAAQTTFTDVPDAIAALLRHPHDQRTVQYLSAHSPESVPLLMQIVENQQTGWVYANSGLIRMNDSRLGPFYIRLLHDNLYLKEADGSRKIFGLGTPNGCLVLTNLFGSEMARSLGAIGYKQAIPALWDATRNGDEAVQASAYGALYRLGAIPLNELFMMASSPEKPNGIFDLITNVGWEKVDSDPHFALGIFDRIIADFPDDRRRLADAHFWKISCYEALHQTDDAIRECNEVLKFTEFYELVSQAKSKLAKISTPSSNR